MNLINHPDFSAFFHLIFALWDKFTVEQSRMIRYVVPREDEEGNLEVILVVNDIRDVEFFDIDEFNGYKIHYMRECDL